MKAYIARDKDGVLFIYDEKPYKMWSIWEGSDACCYPIRDSDLPEGINPQWEDEPIEVELTIKKI